MGLPSQPQVAQDPARAITSAPPSASFEVVFCDDCDDPMEPDPNIHAVTGRNICPTCLEGYLP